MRDKAGVGFGMRSDIAEHLGLSLRRLQGAHKLGQNFF
jgi:hypothetical protein